MCQFSASLPETKSEKCGALVWQPAEDNESSRVAGVLTLIGKRNRCRYTVSEFAADFGRGFILDKLDAGSDTSERYYSCLVGAHGVKACECKGFISTGNCRHLSALAALIEANQL